jgi:SOS-response transcriptional repressor LexA
MMAAKLRSSFPGYRALQVANFVRQRASSTGAPSSYDDIMAALRIKSKGEVTRIVKALELRGILSVTWVSGKRGRKRLVTIPGAEFTEAYVRRLIREEIAAIRVTLPPLRLDPRSVDVILRAARDANR